MEMGRLLFIRLHPLLCFCMMVVMVMVMVMVMRFLFN